MQDRYYLWLVKDASHSHIYCNQGALLLHIGVASLNTRLIMGMFWKPKVLKTMGRHGIDHGTIIVMTKLTMSISSEMPMPTHPVVLADTLNITSFPSTMYLTW